MAKDLGQFIFTGISGHELTVDEKKFLKEENIGGVILFSRNYENPAQLRELVDSIQALKGTHPFYISVDHEGGRVFRFDDFIRPPCMYDLARLGSLEIVSRLVRIMALELRSCGINLNYAPVCDIWNNRDNEVIGDRAFGHDGETVSPFVSRVVRELQSNGILACAKHFPGHGCTLEDSHYLLPIVSKEISELRRNEFLPFIEAIKSGVEFVMMAHIIIDGVDDNTPCSLSEKAHQILREELGFKNLIIADDMQMKAVFDRYGVEEAVVLAVRAGADIVIYRDMGEARPGLEGLKKAVRNRQISDDFIQKIASRIGTSKKKYFSSLMPLPRTVIGSEENRAFAEEIREKITLL